MGGRSSPPPAAPAAPAPTVTPVATTDTSKDPASRAVARRADTQPTAAASLLSGGSGDVDPLSSRKELGGKAVMMG